MPDTDDRWIWINRWETFQHYKPQPGQVPAWTKSYTQLINDDAYLGLSAGRRALLHGLWLSFTSARLRLRFDVTSLNSRMRLSAKLGDYKSLEHAGFITICSRAALDELYNESMAVLESRAPAQSQEKKRKEKTSGVSSKRGDAKPAHVWQENDQPPDTSFITSPSYLSLVDDQKEDAA